jgi:hypothetical protein
MLHIVNAIYFDTKEDSPASEEKIGNGNKQQFSESKANDNPICTQPPL